MLFNYIFLVFLFGNCFASFDWTERHDLLLNNYEDVLRNLETQNYKVKFICNYLEDQTPKVMALLDKDIFRGDVKCKAGMTVDELKQELEPSIVPNFPVFSDYRIINICSYALHGQTYFSITKERAISYPYKVLSVDGDQLIFYIFEYKTNTNKMRLTHLIPYLNSESTQDLYFAVFEQSDAVENWMAEIRMTRTMLDERNLFYESKGFTLRFIHGIELNQTTFYAALWEKVSLLSPTTVVYKSSMSKDEYKNELNKEGYLPKQITVFTSESSPKFNVVWKKETDNQQFPIESIDKEVAKFMSEYLHYGIQLSVTKNERLVYNKAYGKIDSTIDEPLSNENSIKIGSVSKTYASLAIFKLLERGLLKSLDQNIFGPNGILTNDFRIPDYNYANLTKITVRQILGHFSGLADTSKNELQILWIDKLLTKHEYMQQSIDSKYLFRASPGDNVFIYSNNGYQLISFIVEKLSGESFDDFLRKNVLIPCKIGNTMFVANVDGQPKRPNEMLHTVGKLFNYNILDSAGGYVARSQDVAKMLVRIDGLPSKPDIINSEILNMMSENIHPNVLFGAGYGLGLVIWNDGYGHGGETSYTSTIAKIYNDKNLTVSIIMNSGINPIVIETMIKIEEAIFTVNSWPDVDLFDDGQYDTTSTTSLPMTTSTGITFKMLNISSTIALIFLAVFFQNI